MSVGVVILPVGHLAEDDVGRVEQRGFTVLPNNDRRIVSGIGVGELTGLRVIKRVEEGDELIDRAIAAGKLD